MRTNVALFTDSSSEISLDRCTEFGIDRIDLGCHFNDADWTDLDDVDGFYQKLSAQNLAKTSAVNLQQFVELFIPALKAGQDILCLPIVNTLSSTYRNAALAAAELARDYPDRRIIVPDTRCVCGGLEYLVTEVANRLDAGQTLQEVADYVERTKRIIAHHFTADDLEYFYEGGRISRVQKVIGGVLGVKPVLHLDDDDNLTKRKNVRGTPAALAEIARATKETITSPSGRIIISHAFCPGKAETMRNLLLAEDCLPESQIEISRVGVTIGAHAGPTTLAVFFEATHR